MSLNGRLLSAKTTNILPSRRNKFADGRHVAKMSGHVSRSVLFRELCIHPYSLFQCARFRARYPRRRQSYRRRIGRHVCRKSPLTKTRARGCARSREVEVRATLLFLARGMHEMDPRSPFLRTTLLHFYALLAKATPTKESRSRARILRVD